MNDLFLRACRGDVTARKPVWIMRQAGRYLPEYRAVRAGHTFLELCKTPELAAEVTVQPVDILGVDAAIQFADILLPLEAMGAKLHFEEGRGPVFEQPVRNAEDLSRLQHPDVERRLGYVFAAIRQVKQVLGDRVPLIGFGGTPWTLAAYLVEGGTSKHHGHLLAWSWSDPTGLRRLLDALADVSIDYLIGQIEAGAQAVQLFDSWGGLLSAPRWRDVSLPSLLRIIQRLRDRVPVIYYVNGGAHLLDAMKELPVHVLSVDWRVPLPDVRKRVGPEFCLQGNLDPTALLSSIEVIQREAHELVHATAGPHIVNLGHGILPMTPVEHARAFVDAVHATPA
jgi:uroporphyrinogen decarboxylase